MSSSPQSSSNLALIPYPSSHGGCFQEAVRRKWIPHDHEAISTVTAVGLSCPAGTLRPQVGRGLVTILAHPFCCPSAVPPVLKPVLSLLSTHYHANIYVVESLQNIYIHIYHPLVPLIHIHSTTFTIHPSPLMYLFPPQPLPRPGVGTMGSSVFVFLYDHMFFVGCLVVIANLALLVYAFFCR